MILQSLLASSAVAVLPLQVSASAPHPAQQFAVCAAGAPNFFMFQPWYACLPQVDGHPAITRLSDVFLIVFPLVESLVKAAALVAVGVIFYMIIKMLTARGDTGKIASAGLGIRDAIIGLIIALISVAIVNFVAGAFK